MPPFPPRFRNLGTSTAAPAPTHLVPLGFNVVLGGSEVQTGTTWELRPMESDLYKLRVFPMNGQLYSVGLRTFSGPGRVQIEEIGTPLSDSGLGPVDAAIFNPEAIAGAADLSTALDLVEETLSGISGPRAAGPEPHMTRARLLVLRDRLRLMKGLPDGPQHPAVSSSPQVVKVDNALGEQVRFVSLDVGCLDLSLPCVMRLRTLVDEPVRFSGALMCQPPPVAVYPPYPPGLSY